MPHPIREYLARHHMTVAALASAAGVQRANLFHALSGQRGISVKTAFALVAATGGELDLATLLKPKPQTAARRRSA